jgi:hypothetical protein
MVAGTPLTDGAADGERSTVRVSVISCVPLPPHAVHAMAMTSANACVVPLARFPLALVECSKKNIAVSHLPIFHSCLAQIPVKPFGAWLPSKESV